MASSADIHVWEAAEVERSLIEAAQTPPAQLETTEQNLARYLNPPADTPFPLEYAFHLLGNIEGRTVLDYGCGNGENSVPLARRGAHVIGLDVSHALLSLAERRMSAAGMPGRGTFLAASAHDVPLPSASIDVVLGIAILHHLDLDLSAREIHRLLKPGGRAIFQEPVRNSRILKAIRGMIPYKQNDISPYERPLTDAEIERFARPFGGYRARAFSLPFINLAGVVPAMGRHIEALYKADGALLGAAPSLAPFAGIRVFEVVKA